MKASKGRPSAAARLRAPSLKPTVGAEGALALSQSGRGSNLEETAAGFRAARSTQASRRRSLPREQAIASARPAKEEPCVTFWAGLLGPRAGSGSDQPSRETFRRCAQPASARLPSQRLPLVQRL